MIDDLQFDIVKNPKVADDARKVLSSLFKDERDSTMSTIDLQKTDELVNAADMSVRVSSQLRLWSKRRSIEDGECCQLAILFLQQVLDGGKFIESKTSSSGVSSLEPLTWAADLRFGSFAGDSKKRVDYEQLLVFVERIKNTVQSVLDSTEVNPGDLSIAVDFFCGLGKQLGIKADQALRAPSQRYFMAGDRYSY